MGVLDHEEILYSTTQYIKYRQNLFSNLLMFQVIYNQLYFINNLHVRCIKLNTTHLKKKFVSKLVNIFRNYISQNDY